MRILRILVAIAGVVSLVLLVAPLLFQSTVELQRQSTVFAAAVATALVGSWVWGSVAICGLIGKWKSAVLLVGSALAISLLVGCLASLIQAPVQYTLGFGFFFAWVLSGATWCVWYALRPDRFALVLTMCNENSGRP